MFNEIPEWRKAWKTEDPEWVQQREKDWKSVRKSPVFEFRYKKDDLIKVRNFFMTGSAFVPEPAKSEWKWMRYHPDRKPISVTCAPLLECWLGISSDWDRWNEIKKNASEDRIQESRIMFRDTMQKYEPSKGALFNGRDKMLYKFFVPTRCRAEDYPDCKEEIFFKRASRVCFRIRPLIEMFLKGDYDEQSIAEEALPEWCDSVLPAFQSYKRKDDRAVFCRNINDVLSAAFVVLEESDDYSKPQVGAARYIVDRFNAMEFPSGMVKVAKLLATKD